MKIFFWSHYENAGGVSREIKTGVSYSLVTLRGNVYIYLLILKAFSGGFFVCFFFFIVYFGKMKR